LAEKPFNGTANSKGHKVKEAHSHALRLAAIDTGEKHQFSSDFPNVVATTLASAPKTNSRLPSLLRAVA